jgi:uncharacterized protein YbjT (DUF2867 family)
MKILVTGATGFIGAAIARRLVEHSHTVLGLARSESAAARVKSAGLTPIRGDFAEPATLAGAVSQVDVIIVREYRQVRALRRGFTRIVTPLRQ